MSTKRSATPRSALLVCWLTGTALFLFLTAPLAAQECAGDCNGDGAVSVDELITAVQISLANASLEDCPCLDTNADGFVSIDEIVAAVVTALDGCAEVPEIGELVSGTATYVNGTFVWTDYAYDDHGPNADAAGGGDRTQSAFAGGDAEYPAAVSFGNAADLIQLQIGLRRGALTLRAVLETLRDRSLPVLGVAFDTDAEPSTGAATLPGDRWTADGPLGVDVLIVVSTSGGELRRYVDGEWTTAASFPARVNARTNTMDTTVPPSALSAGRATWRAFAALGIATPEGSWLDGAAPIYDLAFVGNELLIRWQENQQADILAGALDSDRAAATIDFARVADGDNEANAPGPGFHTFLYHSTLNLAEGISSDADGNRTYLGPYQPYAVFIPEDMPTPTPLSVFLHGLSQNHLGSVFVGSDQAYLGTGRALSEDPFTLFPQFSQDGFDFPPATLQVLPLARGQALSYRGIAHQDVLDVLTETRRRFDIIADRVTLQGASMGGIGTYRIGALSPDLWSAIVPLIGFQRSSLLPLSENLLNVPVRQINGTIDPLIDEAPATASAARLDELEYDYRYWLINDRGHEAGGFIYDCVFSEVATLVRNPNPARVLYTVDPSLDEIEPAIGLALRFDSAYWVSGIRVRSQKAFGQKAFATEPFGTVDATSLALPHFEETITHIDEIRGNLESGADLCGPNPDVNTGESWRERAVTIEEGALTPGLNALDITLTNVSAASFDLQRAGLDVASASVFVTTDGPAAVTLGGLIRGQTVLRDGSSVATANEAGQATVELVESSVELTFGL